VPVTSLNGTRMVYSCLNWCGGTEKVPSMKMKKVWALANHHQGCYYHLTQASWRQIQHLGLVPLYKNDDDFRVFCGVMDGLAFLPVPDLTNGISRSSAASGGSSGHSVLSR
jgi:hypothetical protein